MRCAFLIFLAMIASGAGVKAQSQALPTDLADYVFKPDPSFEWKYESSLEADGGTLYTLEMVSQTWHTFKWKHELQIFQPKGVKPQKTMLIFNTGGHSGPMSRVIGMLIATKVGAPIAFLYDIPNQPIFEKKEDALIAETFVRYLATKDSSWPLLFPMAKSLIKAMDALQAFSKEHWKTELSQFVVTGASKRGWTSWLTAATGDPRVKAIAPMVIDTLNMQAQMPYQLKSFGTYSLMIHDYVAAKLLPMPNTAEARKLWAMIDPWIYREKLTLPKMIINGSNDPYWAQDALNLYWDDLKGDKYVLYVPNAGHDLREVSVDGNKDVIPARAVSTLAAFAHSQIFDTPMPKLTWKYTPTEDGVDLVVHHDGKVKEQRLWIANSDSRDFRKSRWTETMVTSKGGKLTIPNPEKGYRAVYVESEFERDGQTFSLTTQIRILEAKK